jgi:chromosome segregation ATPase
MKLFLTIISCILIFTLIGCTNSSEQESKESNSFKEELADLKEKNYKLEQKIITQSEEIKSIQVELDEYKDFIEVQLLTQRDRVNSLLNELQNLKEQGADTNKINEIEILYKKASEEFREMKNALGLGMDTLKEKSDSN